MVEELVQFFVGVINAQLFKRIYSEIFETENVKDAEKSGRILSRIRTSVYVVHEPRECS